MEYGDGVMRAAPDDPVLPHDEHHYLSSSVPDGFVVSVRQQVWQLRSYEMLLASSIEPLDLMIERERLDHAKWDATGHSICDRLSPAPPVPRIGCENAR